MELKARFAAKNGQKFIVKLLTNEDKNDVLKLILNDFARKEPIAQICQSSKVYLDRLTQIVETHLPEELSIGIVDKDTLELVAIGVNFTSDYKGKNFVQNIPDPEVDIIKRFFKLVYEGLYNSIIGSSEYFMCRLLVVQNKYKQLGIAREIINRSMDLARQKGYKYLMSLYTSVYTQKIHKDKQIILKEVRYDQYVDKVTGRKEMEKIKAPHISAQLICYPIS